MVKNKSTKNIIIVGRGKFAESLVENCKKFSVHENLKINILFWHEFKNKNIKSLSQDLIIHAGSGRELEEIVEYCDKTKSVFVQASTGLDLELKKILKNNISNLDFVFINAPNLALPIVKFMKILEQTGELFDSKDFKITISESHQSSKKTVPGTAVKFAEALNLNSSKIKSIRDKFEQKDLGVDEEYLDGHAVHWIELEGLGGKLRFKTEIMGRDAYAHGVMKISENFEKISELEKASQKFYNITDLVGLKII